MDQFMVSAEKPDPVAVKEQEVAERMKAEGVDGGTCAKGCGKTFTRGAWREKHEAKCKGEKIAGPRRRRIDGDDGSVEEDPSLAMPKTRRNGRHSGNGSAIGKAIEELRDMKTALEEKIQGVDTAIETLEKMLDP